MLPLFCVCFFVVVDCWMNIVAGNCIDLPLLLIEIFFLNTSRRTANTQVRPTVGANCRGSICNGPSSIKFVEKWVHGLGINNTNDKWYETNMDNNGMALLSSFHEEKGHESGSILVRCFIVILDKCFWGSSSLWSSVYEICICPRPLPRIYFSSDSSLCFFHSFSGPPFMLENLLVI